MPADDTMPAAIPDAPLEHLTHTLAAAVVGTLTATVALVTGVYAVIEWNDRTCDGDNCRFSTFGLAEIGLMGLAWLAIGLFAGMAVYRLFKRRT